MFMKMADLVPRDKFESACRELDTALRREQQAQQLLGEQSHQLNELNSQLEKYTSQSSWKQHNLNEAVQVGEIFILISH